MTREEVDMVLEKLKGTDEAVAHAAVAEFPGKVIVTLWGKKSKRKPLLAVSSDNLNDAVELLLKCRESQREVEKNRGSIYVEQQ